MMRFVASITVLALFAEQFVSGLIIHIKLDDDHMIKVGPDTFGLTGPALGERNLSSIVLNGNDVKKFGFECEVTSTNLYDMNSDDKKAIDELSCHLDYVASPSRPLKDGQKYAITLYSAHNHHIGTTMGVKSSIHQVDQYRVVVHNGEYSVVNAEGPLISNWLIYFVFNDRIAYVSHDSTIHVMPVKCLQPDEIKFVSEVAKKLDEANVFNQST